MWNQQQRCNIIVSSFYRAMFYVKTSAHNPSCVFFLDLHLYMYPYFSYTHKILPMYLHLFNNGATDFISLWTHKYSPYILSSIVTTGNIPSFYASDVTFFLYFLKTNNVSGYITTPLSWRHSMIIISMNVLQLPLYVTHLNI